MNDLKEILFELMDNDTMIIIGVIVIAYLSPEHREIVLAGLLGYMGKKAQIA